MVRPTRSERVFANLREDILFGRLQPGAPLLTAELCARYSTSVGVLREALSRLAEQGLVRSQPRIGFQVAPLSPEDLSELTRARSELEPLVLRHALAEGDLRWESELVAAHHRMEVIARDLPGPDGGADRQARFVDEWSSAHQDFHATLLAGCANRRLVAMVGSLRDSAELYRRWSGALPPDTTRDIAAEHRELLDAVLVRDERTATALLGDHIGRTTEILLDFLATQREGAPVATRGASS